MTDGLQPTPSHCSTRVLRMILSVAFAAVLSGCCGLCDDDKSASGATGGLGDECVDNTNCASGLFCSGGVCVSPGVPGANPGAPGANPGAPATAVADPVAPPQPVPAGVAGTVTANGLTLGTHGCTFYDSTGAYNRRCTLTQNANGTVALRAPGTSLNPEEGFSGTLTGGPEHYGFTGQIKTFDSCTGNFQSTLVRQGNKYALRYKRPGCSLTIHIRTDTMGGGAPAPRGGCNCAHGREYGPEPDINVANGGCARLGCAPNYTCNQNNGNCVCNCR
jgi:hypothetical protein